jgi:hypothetical protein
MRADDSDGTETRQQDISTRPVKGFLINGEAIKTKKALYERLKLILYGYGFGQTIADGDQAFLNDALTQANVFYEYPAEQPSSWRVQQQAMGACPEFVFSRPDGTQENPSIRRLSQQKSKGGKTPRMAARRDVNNQILDFRSSKCDANFSFTCDDPLCGYTSHDGRDFEVDHDDVSFVEIFEGWMSDIGISEASLSIAEQRDATGVMIEYGLNEPFDESFSRYHKRYAKLQLLCKGCHAHKTYKAVRDGERS